MTGDGPRRGARSPHPTPALTVLGVGAGDPDALAEGADLLAEADAVFAAGDPAGLESTLLFYAEAWRVERLADLSGAVAVVADWFGLNPGGRAVLAVAGDPTADPALAAVADGLRVSRPDVRLRTVPGVSVVPPRLSPLPW